MKKTNGFSGIYTALITPFKNGKVDERAFQSLVEWQVTQGVHGLVPVGTTGESPTLSHDEHLRVVELCIEAAGGRVQIMAGTGSNSTEEAIFFTRHAHKAGADAALVVAPYYNKPSQEGLYQHFRAVAEAADIPIFIYNIPGRSVVDIQDATLARLAEVPNIAGVKDATGDLARVAKLRALVGDRLTLLSGEDMTAVGFNAMGGTGCISVTANIVPAACAEVQNLCLRGDFVAARIRQEQLTRLHDAMFCETSPAPVKYAASLLGMGLPEVRLPLVPASQAAQQRVREAMEALKLV